MPDDLFTKSPHCIGRWSSIMEDLSNVGGPSTAQGPRQPYTKSQWRNCSRGASYIVNMRKNLEKEARRLFGPT